MKFSPLKTLLPLLLFSCTTGKQDNHQQDIPRNHVAQVLEHFKP